MKNIKTYDDFLNESKDLKSADFKLSDSVLVTFQDPNVNNNKLQKIKGKIIDHFGNGVLIMLDKALTLFDYGRHNKNKGNYNYQDHSSKYSTSTFELYDDEENEGFPSFKNIKKI